MKIETRIPSTDGKNQLHTVIWEPEVPVRAVMQIAHGMVEYIERYEEFAEFLSASGILVAGNDHLGHGHTAACDDDLGYFGKERSRIVVDDLHEVTRYVKNQYGDVPYILFGHSMGSFLARRYLMTYGEEIDCAIICGTGYTPRPVLGMGILVAKMVEIFKGSGYRATLLKKLAFASYNSRIPDAASPNSWISRNRENVERYDADKYCTFDFTVNGYQTLFDVLDYIERKENYCRINKSTPILMISGDADPVGSYGKGVKKVLDQYRSLGVKDIEMKLYPDDRHEILNEADRKTVYQDILNWLTLRQ